MWAGRETQVHLTAGKFLAIFYSGYQMKKLSIFNFELFKEKNGNKHLSVVTG